MLYLQSLHFNHAFIPTFKMINVYMLQAQADSFWSSEASVNGPNYVSRTEKTMFEETFPVGILRTQAGLSSCDSRGYSKQRTAVALGTSNVQSELLIKRLQHHLLSANQTVWFTGTHGSLWSCQPNSALAAFLCRFVENMAMGLIFLQSLNGEWPTAQPPGFKSLKYMRP